MQYKAVMFTCVHSTYISVCGMWLNKEILKKGKNIAQYKNKYKQYIFDGHIAIQLFYCTE